MADAVPAEFRAKVLARIDDDEVVRSRTTSPTRASR